MKNHYKWSYTTQIFLSIMLLIMLPMLVFGVFISNKTVDDINRNYLNSLSSMTAQLNLNIDSSMAVAKNMGVLHLLNDEIRRSLNNPYDVNSYEFAVTYKAMQNYIAQALQQNPNVLQVIFTGRNGMVYDFGVQSVTEVRRTVESISALEAEAEKTQRMYYGEVWRSDYPAHYNKDILPIVQVLQDQQNSRRLGVVYISYNFNAIRNITESIDPSSGNVVLLDSNNQLFYNLRDNSEYLENGELSSKLSEFAAQVDARNPAELFNFRVGGREYWASIALNATTGWKIVNYLDNSIIIQAFRENIKYFLILSVIVIVLAAFLAYATSRTLTKAFNRLCTSIDDLESGTITEFDINDQFLNRELTKISESYLRLNSRLMSSMEQNYMIRLNEKQMSLDMLRSQINPHFLYNTFNLISAFANIHNVPEIRAITTLMSDLLRYNLKSAPIVRLEEEVAQIDRYVRIQQIRFPGRFIYECDIPDLFHPMEVPVFILQPLVENAINHGLSEKEQGGVLSITAHAREGHDEMHIQISDNGCGMTPDNLKRLHAVLWGEEVHFTGESGDSMGIRNVQQRIQAYYSAEYGLSVHSTLGDGTVIDICLPLGTPPRTPT